MICNVFLEKRKKCLMKKGEREKSGEERREREKRSKY